MLQPENLEIASTRMYAEAREAADCVASQATASSDVIRDVGASLRRRQPKLVLTIARGSSDHAATYAKYLIETFLGTPVSSFAPSVSSIYNTSQDLRETVAIAISQSGKSPDIVKAAHSAKNAGAFLITLVNDINSPLAQTADIAVPLHAYPETSVAATKSFIASLAMIARIAGAWENDIPYLQDLAGLPDALSDAWDRDWSMGMSDLACRRNLFVIARGIGLALAQEAALKFKETCRLHAESYSAAEVLHGPAAIIDPGFPVLAFAQNDAAKPGLVSVVEKLSGMGAKVLLAGAEHPSALNLPTVSIHPALEPITQAQSFYRLVNALSVTLSLNPDAPPHLNKVTETV